MSHGNSTTTCTIITQPCTPLMYVEVASIVSPRHQAYLRSAGSGGVSAYEELVQRGKVGLYVEQPLTTALSGTPLVSGRVESVPITLPLQTKNINYPPPHNDAILVVKHSYLFDHPMPLAELQLHPIKKLRYVGGLEFSIIQLVNMFMVEDAGYEEVHTIELSGFRGATIIGDFFLQNTPCLTSIQNHADEIVFDDGRIIEIGNDFVADCGSLTSIDLSPFRNVRSVGSNFLGECKSLTEVDLSPLSNLTVISDDFLNICTSLTNVSLSPFSNVTEVGSYFLGGCSGLLEIDLQPLGNVTTIGPYFMVGCGSLTTLDLRPFKNIVVIPHYFGHGCKSLIHVNISTLTAVTKVGRYFLGRCGSLRTIDLGGFGNVTEVAEGFLAHCIALTTVDMNPLCKVDKPGGFFMEDCCSGIDGGTNKVMSAGNTKVVMSKQLRMQWNLPENFPTSTARDEQEE